MPGVGCYAFFLTAQGRILADANIFAMTDYLLIDTEPETKAARLRPSGQVHHCRRCDVCTISRTTMRRLMWKDPHAEEVLKHLDAPAAHLPCAIAEWHHSEVAHVSYTGQPGYFVLCPLRTHERMNGEASRTRELMQADIATADVVRIENAKPALRS